MHALRCWARRCALCVFVAFSWHLGTAQTTAQTEPDPAVVESIRHENLQPHVSYLASDKCDGREPGSDGGRNAAKYVQTYLKKLPLKDAGSEGSMMQPFPPGFSNILAMLPGTNSTNHQVIIVCAHYDHVGHGSVENSRGPIGQIHYGADDNASGVSAVLELAAAFARLPQAPSRSILFAFWDAQEDGLLGSRYWIAHPTLPLESVAAVVNLDMVGRLSDRCLTVYGSRTAYGLRRLVSAVNSDFRFCLDLSWELNDDSDHFSFVEAGIPGLFLSTGDHADTHSPRDRAEKVNYSGAEQVARFAFRLVYDLAERPTLPEFRQAATKETEEVRYHFESSAAGPLALVALDEDPSQLGLACRADDAEVGVAILTHVVPHSPSATAGLQSGDRIYRIQGRNFADAREFRQLLDSAGSSFQLLVERDGQLYRVEVSRSPVQLARQSTIP